MTRTQFTEAAAEGRRVRLIDRSRIFCVDKWYDQVWRLRVPSSLTADTPERESTSATACSRS